MRWLLLGGIFWAVLALSLQAQTARAYTLAVGRLSPTVQEAQECIFPLGQGASILLHPNGEPCVLLRGLDGSTGRLVFYVDP